MAGKHKNRKKNHHHHHHNENNAHQFNEQDLCDLVQQATQMHVLLNNRYEQLKKVQNYAYILSTKWLTQWKEYVGYGQLFCDDEQGKKKMGRKKPGPPNTDLLVSNTNYFTVPEQLEQYSFLNQVINDKFDMYDDYIAITPQLWQKIQSIYGQGQQIKRPLRLKKSGSVQVDGSLSSCQFIFINYMQDDYLEGVKKQPNKKLNEVLPLNRMQYSEIWSFKDLYDYLRKYCLINYYCEQVTLWMAECFLGAKSLQEMFADSVRKQTYKMQVRKINQNDYSNLDLDQFLKSYYVLIVEVGKSMIIKQQLPEIIYGYCQQCVEKKTLDFHCSCNQVHYCSNRCRIDDQVFHYNWCSQAFDSDDDDQLKQKKVKSFGICGLVNLGNTCYINSSIQALFGLEFLYKFFGLNLFKTVISKTQQNAYTFLLKMSKLVKMMNQEQIKGSLEPWSLKGQINYFLPPFKGYKQHDANQFISHFLNLISQCLEKQQGEMHHLLIKQSLIGKFNSLVICPHCGQQVKNVQDFLQLTLPIKTKTYKSLFSYVVFESPTVLRYGKAEILSSWQEIYQVIGFQVEKRDCLVLVGKENEDDLQRIDKEADTEKYLKKLKKQVLFYPHLSIKQGDLLLKAHFSISKVLCGVSMRAIYGYPFPVITNQTETTAHLLINLVTKVLQSHLNTFQETFHSLLSKNMQIEEQKQKIYKKVAQKTEAQATKESENNQSALKSKENDEQLNQLIKQQTELSQSLTIFLAQTLKFQVYIIDTRKVKGKCHFCHKKCQGCEIKPDFSVSIAEFLCHKAKQIQLMVNLPQKLTIEKNKLDIAQDKDVSLQDCITLFGEPEQLDQQNAWYCHQCEDMRLAYKQLNICVFPEYLVIQFNRFKNSQNHQHKVKNNQPISYQEFENFGDCKYQLISVIIHQGSVDAGHYWAISLRQNNYYIFNDDKVSKTDKFCNKNAYILFYKRIKVENKQSIKQQKIVANQSCNLSRKNENKRQKREINK